jgi:hypothetical protein
LPRNKEKQIIMKSVLSLLAVATVIALSATGCTSASNRAIAVHDAPTLSWPLDELSTSDLAGDRTFRLEPGNHREAVLTQLGLPQAAAGQDIWIFTNTRSPNAGTRALAYDTLVVAFADDRITHLRLVNGRQASEILARAQTRAPSSLHQLAAADE